MADAVETESPGAALVRIRWAKTTKAERMAVARTLVEARKKKLEARKKNQALAKDEVKPSPRKRRK